jgi:hypothetical protein
MSRFEGTTIGNLASTPVNAVAAYMSPTEKAAIEEANGSKKTTGIPMKPTTIVETAGFAWETLSEETWSEPKFGDAISNFFRRVTRKVEVPGGYLYSVATYGICYVRGTANSNTSETVTFVPAAAGAAPVDKKKAKETQAV